MQDRELLAKISLLKEIKPRQDWVVLTKTKILGFQSSQKTQFLSIFQLISDILNILKKPAFILALFLFLFGGGIFVQLVKNSVPGDALYRVKAKTEQIRVAFSSEKEKPFLQLQLAQKRLEELKKLAQRTQKEKLSSAIKEYEASAKQASEGFSRLVENQPDKALQAGLRVVQLQKEKLELEKVLGTQIGSEKEDLENITRVLVENELAELRSRTLTEEQKSSLAKAQSAFEAGDYQTALEILWSLSNK